MVPAADAAGGCSEGASPPSPSPRAVPRAWVVAGLHTKRAGMRGFFDAAALARHRLALEAIWERDCDGAERGWVPDRGEEGMLDRKRWLVVGVLRRV
jgi:hypothetical protein